MTPIRYLSNRLRTYAVFPQDPEIETQIISAITCNNHFNLNILDQVNYESNKHSKQEHSRMSKKNNNNHKRIFFTYVGKETKFITKLFRSTNINRSYKTKNVIEKISCLRTTGIHRQI